MIHRVQLVIQLAKSDIAYTMAGVRAQISTQERIGLRALRCSDGGRAGKVRTRRRRKSGTRVAHREDFARTIIREKVKQLVLDRGSTHAAAELLLLMYTLGRYS